MQCFLCTPEQYLYVIDTSPLVLELFYTLESPREALKSTDVQDLFHFN